MKKWILLLKNTKKWRNIALWKKQLLCISKTVSKASLYHFSGVQTIGSIKILNQSLDNATFMLSLNYQKVVQENKLPLLRDEGPRLWSICEMFLSILVDLQFWLICKRILVNLRDKGPRF